MPHLVLQAYWQLIRFDWFLIRGDFAGLYRKVRDCRIYRVPESPVQTIDQICNAVDRACTWYWKEALCLQRSAATVCLLKHHGVEAQLVVGAQSMPFRAHAWVEVDGRVVNDWPYMREMYAVLDRC
jgi:hypothetical protein